MYLICINSANISCKTPDEYIPSLHQPKLPSLANRPFAPDAKSLCVTQYLQNPNVFMSGKQI